MRHDFLNRWSEQALLSTGDNDFFLSSSKPLSSSLSSSLSWWRWSGLHEEVCRALQCLQICNCAQRGTDKGDVLMIMIKSMMIMMIKNIMTMMIWLIMIMIKIDCKMIAMETIKYIDDQYLILWLFLWQNSMTFLFRWYWSSQWHCFLTISMIRMTLLFLTTMPFQASRIHALDKDFHPHCFKCEVANTCIIIIIITTTTIIIVIITRTARWFSTLGWRGRSVGQSGSTCSAWSATGDGRTRVNLRRVTPTSEQP